MGILDTGHWTLMIEIRCQTKLDTTKSHCREQSGLCCPHVWAFTVTMEKDGLLR